MSTGSFSLVLVRVAASCHTPAFVASWLRHMQDLGICMNLLYG